MRIRDIAIIGVMSAIIIVAQVALAFLPNIELVSLLIILCTLVLGTKSIFIVYVFVMVEGMLYGFGMNWVNYMYVWTILFIIVMLFRKIHSTIFWAIVSGFYGLSFGALCSIPYFLTGGIASGFAYWVAGIPFDIAHGIGNFGAAIVLFYPLYTLLDKVSKRTEYLNY